ncbi:MAG: hypothetical protein CK425_10555 [Parachlamydia sp.]|nr:MAG: hypothetical protein CK425_10555 [Parachlamydia sp.]
MIETMITKTKKYLPLKITEIAWDGTIFQLYGSNWNFTTLSAWRISTKNQMIFGCYDSDSTSSTHFLKNLKIIDIEIQDALLKIDPVFILSNDQRIEIFSTDTFEPWTFYIDGLEMFIATPSEIPTFDPLGAAAQPQML